MVLFAFPHVRYYTRYAAVLFLVVVHFAWDPRTSPGIRRWMFAGLLLSASACAFNLLRDLHTVQSTYWFPD